MSLPYTKSSLLNKAFSKKTKPNIRINSRLAIKLAFEKAIIPSMLTGKLLPSNYQTLDSY